MKIAVLLTVHNRKEKTLNCLNALMSQQLPDGCQTDVFLTDDGCTDGTPEAVAKQFPDVNIITGDGNLFWSRGMHLAWKTASDTYDYDYYLWLNDDTILFEDALRTLLSVSEEKVGAVIVGPTCATDNRMKTTYSGIDKHGRVVNPDGGLQQCHTFNGNIVLVPQIIFHRIGNLDYVYHHALGDLDYGMCVRRAGYENFVAPKHCGMCDHNPTMPAWVRPEIPFAKRWKNFHSPLAYGEPKTLFYYNRKNFGFMHALRVYISNHIRVVFPSLKKM